MYYIHHVGQKNERGNKTNSFSLPGLGRNPDFYFWFASRWNSQEIQRIDIGIIGKKEIDGGKLVMIEEAFEQSDIPFTVDIVDFSKTSGRFKKIAMKKNHCLKETLDWESTVRNQDATIQRFEFTFELSWKFINAIAKENGIDAYCPKNTFRDLEKRPSWV